MEKRVSVQEEIISILSRLRMLEDKQANLQRKLHMFDDQTATRLKEIHEHMSMLDDELLEVRKQVKDLHELVERITKTLQQTAMKDELRMLEKYVNLMDPTRYVTRDYAQKLIREEVERALTDLLPLEDPTKNPPS